MGDSTCPQLNLKTPPHFFCYVHWHSIDMDDTEFLLAVDMMPSNIATLSPDAMEGLAWLRSNLPRRTGFADNVDFFRRLASCVGSDFVRAVLAGLPFVRP
jgi:hypothetical protein